MKTNIEKLFLEFVSKDKASLQKAKVFAIDNCLYELGANIRDLEKEKFPDDKENNEVIERCKQLETVLRMCNIKSDLRGVYILDRCLSAYDQFKKDFDLRMAAKITTDADEIFG